MKKVFICFIALIIFLGQLVIVDAVSFDDLPQDELYTVAYVDGNGLTIIDSADTYKKALTIYNRHLDEEDDKNLIISHIGKIYKAEYGVVAIHSTEKCDYNVEFNNDEDGSSNYTNGCFGKDAAYLDTNTSGSRVEFRISGVNGWASIDDVDIIPLEMIDSRLSLYSVIDNGLYHQIKFSFDTDYFSTIIDLGKAPEYLENGKDYYSYDGHYFYEIDDLKTMLIDYQNGNFDHSLNLDNPYYNYYQYVTHRTLTNVNEEQVEDYFYNTLNVIGPIYSYEDMDKDSADDALMRSQFYDNLDAFYQYQYEYGANALMMLSLSTNESATGRSSLSFTRNNLFGHAAYDSDVEKNASRYFNVRSSIYSHSKYYISGSYCNPSKFQYNGGFFGNKSNGMNVSYASDPYWGEKAAQNYARYDEAFGTVDLNSYTLGIKNSNDSVNIYQYPENGAKVLYSTSKTSDYSFVILDTFSNESGDWFKIQSDATLNEASNVDLVYYYDYQNDVAYIKQNSIQVVIPGSNQDKKMVSITMDASGGVYENGDSVITYQLPEGSYVALESPEKENALFIGYDNQDTTAIDGAYYSAQYKDSTSIELINTPKTAYELNDRIDVLNGLIKVNYADGTSEEVVLTTSMISGYDMTSAVDQEVTVTYAGQSLTYPITVSEELDTKRAEIKAEIVSCIDELANKDTLSDEDINRLKTLKNNIDTYMLPYLTQPQLTQLDSLMYKAVNDEVLYGVSKNAYDASITGLSTSIIWKENFEHGMFKDYYVFDINQGISTGDLDVATKVANGNGYDVLDSFKIDIKENGNTFDNLHAPIIITIKKPEGALNTQVFTVFTVINGEVRKCYTKQTDNYIEFMSNNTGSFVLVSKDTTNDYSAPDILGTVNSGNSASDPANIVKVIGAIAAGVVIAIIAIIVIVRKKRKHDTEGD